MTPEDLSPQWVAATSDRPARGGPSGEDWLASLPALRAAAGERWDLLPDGPPVTREAAVLLPVARGPRRLTLVLDLPRTETGEAHVALRLWQGNGAPRLVAALPSEGASLLERVAPLDETWWADPICEAVGDLLPRLHRPAPPRVASVDEGVGPVLHRMGSEASVPRRVARRTAGLARDLLGTGPRVLLHTALDDRTLMTTPEGDPVAVLPRPLAGHPAWDLWPALRMMGEDLGTGSALRWSVRHRLSLVTAAAGLDEEEARAWSLLRAGVELGRAAALGGTPDTLDLAVMKALDD